MCDEYNGMKILQKHKISSVLTVKINRNLWRFKSKIGQDYKLIHYQGALSDLTRNTVIVFDFDYRYQ